MKPITVKKDCLQNISLLIFFHLINFFVRKKLINGTEIIRIKRKVSLISNTILLYNLSVLSEKYDFKVIHISTDAVFAKNSGKSIETDIPLPEDIYGMTKYLGEISHKNVMNIRTSLIGLSPFKKSGLIEFALNSTGRISGYTNQKWSGCTNLQFAKLCEHIIYEKINLILIEKFQTLSILASRTNN